MRLLLLHPRADNRLVHLLLRWKQVDRQSVNGRNSAKRQVNVTRA
jgi:hypothetical protein